MSFEKDFTGEVVPLAIPAPAGCGEEGSSFVSRKGLVEIGRPDCDPDEGLGGPEEILFRKGLFERRGDGRRSSEVGQSGNSRKLSGFKADKKIGYQGEHVRVTDVRLHLNGIRGKRGVGNWTGTGRHT